MILYDFIMWKAIKIEIKRVGPTKMERVSTGIEELDRKLSGGYPVNKVTLITGIAGSGKTIFGIHFIYRNCLKAGNA